MGHPGWGPISSSVCRGLIGTASLTAQLVMLGWREAMMMAPPTGMTPAVPPCSPWLCSFPPQTFPTMISSSHPFNLSLQSAAALELGLFHSPQTPACSCCFFQVTSIFVPGMCCGLSDSHSICRLQQISCFNFRLKMFLLWLRHCLHVGIKPCFWPLTQGVQRSLLTPSVFPLLPVSYFSWLYIYIFFHGYIYIFHLLLVRVILSTLRWYSAGTSSAFESLFLIYPWRDILHTRVAISISTGFLDPGIELIVSCIGKWILLHHWAILLNLG